MSGEIFAWITESDNASNSGRFSAWTHENITEHTTTRFKKKTPRAIPEQSSGGLLKATRVRVCLGICGRFSEKKNYLKNVCNNLWISEERTGKIKERIKKKWVYKRNLDEF